MNKVMAVVCMMAFVGCAGANKELESKLAAANTEIERLRAENQNIEADATVCTRSLMRIQELEKSLLDKAESIWSDMKNRGTTDLGEIEDVVKSHSK